MIIHKVGLQHIQSNQKLFTNFMMTILINKCCKTITNELRENKIKNTVTTTLAKKSLTRIGIHADNTHKEIAAPNTMLEDTAAALGNLTESLEVYVGTTNNNLAFLLSGNLENYLQGEAVVAILAAAMLKDAVTDGYLESHEYLVFSKYKGYSRIVVKCVPASTKPKKEIKGTEFKKVLATIKKYHIDLERRTRQAFLL